MVEEYKWEFAKLSCFALEMVDIKEKTTARFTVGLRDDIHDVVATLALADYAAALGAPTFLDMWTPKAIIVVNEQESGSGQKRKFN